MSVIVTLDSWSHNHSSESSIDISQWQSFFSMYIGWQTLRLMISGHLLRLNASEQPVCVCVWKVHFIRPLSKEKGWQTNRKKGKGTPHFELSDKTDMLYRLDLDIDNSVRIGGGVDSSETSICGLLGWPPFHPPCIHCPTIEEAALPKTTSYTHTVRKTHWISSGFFLV